MKNDHINILYDHQIFSLQKVGGISRYFVELFKKLPDSNCSGLLPNIYSDNLYLDKKLRLPIPSKLNPKISGRINEYFSRYNSIKELRSDKYDLFHPTYYSTYHLGKSKKPMIATVHDMIHELYPSHFRNPQALIKSKRKLLLAADRIISVSHHTKNDVLKFIDIDPAKIDVIHLASSILEVSPRELQLPFSKFILFVGQRKGYKNFKGLAEAFSKVKDLSPDFYLLCVGGGAFDKDELKLLAELKIQDRTVQKGASDSELAWAYQNAQCFVFSSLYEGFGIPILESMCFGTLTVLSDTSCFPEIAKNAALYFKNVSELSEILSSVIKDNLDRSLYQQKGLKLAGEYSWDRVARGTTEVYRKLV